jgi:predicted small lipoprotein YifL
MISRVLILALVTATGLSACGRRGDLEQPAPLFGSRAKAEYEAQRAAQQETTRREGEREDARAPVPDPSERLEPASRNVPATREPIDGANDPVGRRPNVEQGGRRPG